MAYVAAYVPCTALLFAIRLHVAYRDERDLPAEWYVHPPWDMLDLKLTYNF